MSIQARIEPAYLLTASAVPTVSAHIVVGDTSEPGAEELETMLVLNEFEARFDFWRVGGHVESTLLADTRAILSKWPRRAENAAGEIHKVLAVARGIPAADDTTLDRCWANMHRAHELISRADNPELYALGALALALSGNNVASSNNANVETAVESVATRTGYKPAEIAAALRAVNGAVLPPTAPASASGAGARSANSAGDDRVPDSLHFALTHLNRMCALLDIDTRVAELATHLLRQSLREPTFARRNPVSISAAALYLACTLEEVPRRHTQFQVCTVANITEVTLRNTVKELSDIKDRLLPDSSRWKSTHGGSDALGDDTRDAAEDGFLARAAAAAASNKATTRISIGATSANTISSSNFHISSPTSAFPSKQPAAFAPEKKQDDADFLAADEELL